MGQAEFEIGEEVLWYLNEKNGYGRDKFVKVKIAGVGPDRIAIDVETPHGGLTRRWVMPKRLQRPEQK